MRAVVQRVKEASVTVENNIVSEIKQGLLILLGIEPDDGQKDIEYIVRKCLNLRIFDDSNGVMNLSALNISADILLVSQFTLMGDVRHGNRPSYIAAAPPSDAEPIYEKVITEFRASGLTVGCGVFGADMSVSLVNNGPVTILIDSKKLF